MEKPIYIQPSINLSIEEQIAYNLEYAAKLDAYKQWLAEQNTTTEE